MALVRNPGRVAGLWYLLLIFLGPLRLIYIPSKLFVTGSAAATVDNIGAHQQLFRLGIASDLVGAVVLVLLTLAFYRLFAEVDRNLAVMVVIFGGVMPALLYFTGVVADLGALTVVRGAGFLSVFEKSQQDALTMLLLKLRDLQNTAAETLWGVWLLPLGMLVYRSRFLPRFLGVWLTLGGAAYLAVSLTGVLAPQYQGQIFTISQPFTFAEIAFTLWLVIKGSATTSPLQVSRSGERPNRADSS
ncbi:MAG: DUF4386 domain-containing protein [Terriglobales bacterium]